MSRPTLDSAPFGTSTTNGTTSPIDSIPVGGETPYFTPLTRPTLLPEQNGKVHVPADPESKPPFSDSSLNKYNSSKDRNPIILLKNKHDNLKRCLKHRKYDVSYTSSSDYDLYNNSDYRRKRHKKKSHRKKDLIKLCARLPEKLLTTAYKLKIIRFKMDKDAL